MRLDYPTFDMKRILFSLLLGIAFVVATTGAEAKTYLVAVGISDYPGSANDLRHPTDDVHLVVNTYKGLSADMSFVQLFDNKATINNILNAVQSVFSKAGADDIVVLYISGHGYEGGFVAYDGFLAWDRLRKAVGKCRSKRKMIFADTCFSGTFRSRKNVNNSTSTRPKSDVMLFLSSRSNETSAESGSLKQGGFSAFLCSGLRGRADANRDKVVSAKELYNYVHSGVVRKTAGRQHPVMWGNFSSNMPVIKLK